MDGLILPVWPPPLTDTMRIAVALVFAGLFGEGAARLMRLPRVCGYSIAGLMLGPLLLGWFDAHHISALRIVIDLALALLLFELGNRVDLNWFRTNPWIIPTSIAEAGLCFVGAFTVLHLMGATPGISATVAAIAINTSPSVVMLIASEQRSEGQVTQRLLVFTALNVLYSVVLSKLIVGAMHGAFRNDWSAAVLHPAYLLGGSLMMGGAIAVIFRLLRRGFDLSDEYAATILFGLLLLSLSLLQAFSLPTMLAPLLAGIMVKNSGRRPIQFPPHFGIAGSVLVILSFVLTGAALTGKELALGGIAALAVIAVRMLGKGIGVAIFGPVSGLSLRQSLALGLGLLPMSAVSILLLEDIRSLYPDFGAQVGMIVLCMVAILQIAGPIGVQWALRFSNETNDRRT